MGNLFDLIRNEVFQKRTGTIRPRLGDYRTPPFNPDAPAPFDPFAQMLGNPSPTVMGGQTLQGISGEGATRPRLVQSPLDILNGPVAEQSIVPTDGATRPRLYAPPLGILDGPVAEQRVDLAMPENAYEQNPNSVRLDGMDNATPPPPAGEIGTYAPDRLGQLEMEGRRLRDPNNRVTNSNPGFWGRLKDIGREAVIGAGQAYQMGLKSGLSPEEALAGSIGGATVGGVAGGIDPTMHEQRIRLRDIGRNQAEIGQEREAQEWRTKQQKAQAETDLIRQKPDIEREKIRQRVESASVAFERRMQVLAKQQEFAKGQWEPYVDGQGRVSKKYKDGRLEPVINPTTGEQDVDPTKQTFEVYDPVTQQNIRATGGQILSYSGAVQQGNANRQQQVDIKNAEFNLQAQKSNVEAVAKYNAAIASKIIDVIKASGQNVANVGEMTGIQSELQTNQAALAEAIDAMSSAAEDSDERKAATDRYNKLVDKVNDLSGKLLQAVGKTEAGATMLRDISNMGLTPPSLVKAPAVRATQIQNPGRKVPLAQDPLKILQ